ncbi:MAG: hypothetical protein QGI75_02005 [Phycisphaerales bacterium]|nr:hypothetical protein [Phycisphaerales bacterium]MDP6891119.1 hypothetical protein [Phycisphaerales bacterium]
MSLLRWSGRLIGSLYFAFFAFMLLGHLFGDEPFAEKPLTGIEIAIFIAIGVSQLGVVLCWWKPLLGGGVMVIGWVGLICLQWFLILNPFFGLPAIAGVLLILAAWRERFSRGRVALEPASLE